MREFIKKNAISHSIPNNFKGILVAFALLGSPLPMVEQCLYAAPSNDAYAFNQAETRTVTGVVKDVNGEALIGVNVLLKGTTTGTITDFDGNFSLQVPANGVLVVSYIGYQTTEIKLTSKDNYEVVLKEDSKVLGEVVVTAMGIERKAASLTYATQTVNNKELTRAKDVNFVNALQGKSAGLTITPNSSGAGGGASKIILRGQSSMIGNNQPLIVLDGIPLANGMQDQIGAGSLMYGGGRDGGDVLSTINPEDIASMTILKGANAAALYGSAANNGVIVITTKGGREGNLRVDVSSNSTFEQAIMLPEFQTSFGGQINGYSGVGFDGWGGKLSDITAEEMSRYPYLTNDQNLNKLDGFFDMGMTFNNSVALSGGTEKMRTYFSYANTTQRGVFDENKFKRHNLMLKQTYHLFNNKLHLDFSLNYINQKLNNRPSVGKTYSSLFGLYRTPANIDMRYFRENYYHIGTKEDEMVSNTDIGNRHLEGYPVQTWEWFDQYVNNPYWIRNMVKSENITNRILSSFTAKIDLYEGLTAQARLSVEQNLNKGWDSKNATTNRESRIKGGIYWVGNDWTRDIFSDYLLTYNKRFNDKIDFNVSAGTSLKRNRWGIVESYNEIDTAALFPNIFLPQNDKRKVESSSNTSTETWGSNWEAAVFATTQIGFYDIAYIDASFRTDWSKAFQQFVEPGKKYKGFSYWSLGGNVLLKDLIAKYNEKVNSLKLRASYSVVGNSIPNVVYAAQTLDFHTGALSPKMAPFDNPKPETTNSFEVGFDGSFFNNSFDFDVTYYNTVLHNQVMQISTSSGQNKYVNSGSVRNQGIEITANYRWRINNEWSWYTGATFAYNDNKILSTYTPEGSDVPNPIELDLGQFRIKFLEGGSYGDIYMNEIKRDKDGKILVDKNGNPQMTSDFSKYVGNNTANTTFGWHNTFVWKDLSLYILLDGKVGGKVVSVTQAELDAYGLSQRTADSRLNNPEGLAGINNGKDVAIPWKNYYYTTGSSMTEDYVYDATNIRVREVSLAYTFRNLFGNSKDLSVSVIGRNLGFIFKKSPVDPDISVTAANALSGIDIYSLPTTRSFGINLKATF